VCVASDTARSAPSTSEEGYAKNVLLSFSNESLTVTRENGYDLVGLADKGIILASEEPGSPILPCKYIKLLVPPTAKYESLIVNSISTQKIQGTFTIYPAQKAHRIGEKAPSFTPPDPDMYGSTDKYPQETVRYVKTSVIRGYRFFVFRINPLQYKPAQKELYLNSEISFRVKYTLCAAESLLGYEKVNKRFEELARRAAVNPEELGDISFRHKSGWRTCSTSDNVEYLLITSESLKASFGSLAEWKTKKGVPAEIVTVEHIIANYNGSNTTEKIKDCIIDYVTNKGTEWVMLGGDTDTLPATSGYCDIFFSCLDGPKDREPDVFVGRGSVRTVGDAQAFVDKVLAYEKSIPGSGFARIAYLGNVFNYGYSKWTYDYFVEPYLGSDAKLYDNSAITKFLEGYNFYNLICHGQYVHWTDAKASGVDFTVTDALAMTNKDRQGIIYSVACLSGGFDQADTCLSEAFLRNPNGGGVCYIGNCRSGWAVDVVPSGGWSHDYNNAFYEKVFKENV
jgi:hypothetical protein